VTDVLIHRREARHAGEYVQHSPQMADGVPALRAALDALAKDGHPLEYDQIHRVLGEGEFALVISEGRFGGQPTAFYDLFRVTDGAIAEHWDVLEPIPPRADWKNENGKF
jgi:predicted SnoaL-like aldol condensation-catalyzing enzyme